RAEREGPYSLRNLVRWANARHSAFEGSSTSRICPPCGLPISIARQTVCAHWWANACAAVPDRNVGAARLPTLRAAWRGLLRLDFVDTRACAYAPVWARKNVPHRAPGIFASAKKSCWPAIL